MIGARKNSFLSQQLNVFLVQLHKRPNHQDVVESL